MIFLGAGFNERTSYLWDADLLGGKKIAQVDRDAAQLGKVFPALMWRFRVISSRSWASSCNAWIPTIRGTGWARMCLAGAAAGAGESAAAKPDGCGISRRSSTLIEAFSPGWRGDSARMRSYSTTISYSRRVTSPYPSAITISRIRHLLARSRDPGGDRATFFARTARFSRSSGWRVSDVLHGDR